MGHEIGSVAFGIIMAVLTGWILLQWYQRR